ncbi:MAG: transposase [Myxococcales bacterium]|nr:transposase [Myxococcales bacterium]
MRTSTAEQLPLVPQISGHKHMDELREMSKIIDLHPQAAQLVLSDLVAGGINPKRGAKGLCGEQVIRAALIKQTNGCSYEQLAFHLADSLSYRAFCRLGFSDTPSSSTLQDNVKKIRRDPGRDQPNANRLRRRCWSQRRAQGPNRLHGDRLEYS